METLGRYRAPFLGAYLLCAFMLAAVAGCGGGGSADSAAAQNPAPPPAPAAAPPTISGTPTAQATAGQPYSFTPTTTDPSGGTLSFSVQNMPSWAAFSTASGKLSGTPASSSVGTFANIVISVGDGHASASLAAFSITVASPSPSAPTIGGTPPGQVTAGQNYSFTPTVSGPLGLPLSFSVQNLPTWATFSSATGTLSGTPSSSNVGTFANIMISVNAGPASASLTPFSISVAAPLLSGSVTLAWVAPTTNADGTPLTDLAGYTINYGNSPSAMNQTVRISSPTGTSYTIQNLSAGSWYFSVTAQTSVGTTSPASNVASVTIS